MNIAVKHKEIIMNLIIKLLRVLPLNWLHELDIAVRAAFHGKESRKESFMIYTEIDPEPQNLDRFNIPKDLKRL